MKRKKKEKRYTVTVAFKDDRCQYFHCVTSIGGSNDPDFLVIVKAGMFVMLPKDSIASVVAVEE